MNPGYLRQLEHWAKLVKPLFPGYADIEVRYEDEPYCIEIDWYLGGDPARLHKRSRKIHIVISEEAIEDYLETSQEIRKQADMVLYQLVADQYQGFDPDHDSPRSSSPPVVNWVITTEMLNS